MLAEFFNIRRAGSTLFEGLKISHNKELCNKWMHKYPVIMLSLKTVEGKNFDLAYGEFTSVIKKLCIDHAYLLNDINIDSDEREELRQLKAGTAPRVMMHNSLLILCRAMTSLRSQPHCSYRRIRCPSGERISKWILFRHSFIDKICIQCLSQR